MRFIASADWQLGKQATFLPEEARIRYAQARLEAVKRIARLAETEGADFVVVCGDVFESNQLDPRVLSRSFEALRAFTVPVYLLPGNHDPLDASSIYHSAAWDRGCPSRVHVLEEPGLAATVKSRGGPDVDLIAAPWFSKTPRTDLAREALEKYRLQGERSGVLRVLLAHGAVASLAPDRDSLSTIDDGFLRAALKSGELDFVVVGDRHGTYEVAPGLWYPGTPEVTAEREVNPGNVLLVDLDAASSERSTVEVVPVGGWTLAVLEFALNGDEDLDLLQRRLDGYENKDRTGLKLAVSGTLSIRQKARFDDLLEDFGDLFARLDIWERHTDLAVLPEDGDFRDLNLSGFTQEAARTLQEQARTGSSDAAVAADALGLLFRLAGGGQ